MPSSLPPPDVLPKSSTNILRGADTPNVKKKHRRAKSGIKGLDGTGDGGPYHTSVNYLLIYVNISYMLIYIIYCMLMYVS